MPQKPSWVRFYASDWLAGTRGLTAAETGVYITLIAMMYERGVPLSFSDTQLARLCGTPPARFSDALETLIGRGHIVRRDAGLWNDRVEIEIQRSASLSTIGRQSSEARWSKKRNKNNDPPMRSHRSRNAIPEPELEEETPPKGGAKKDGPAIAVPPPPKLPKHAMPPKGPFPIPFDWCLTPDDYAWGEGKGISMRDLDAAAEAMKAWAESKGEKRHNWAATWRSWVLRKHERARDAPRDPMIQIAEELEEANRRRRL